MAKSKPSAKKTSRGGPKAADTAAELVQMPSFETALERLETSVSRLEEGEMALEEALELFEAGVKLSRQCQSTLEQAERRVEILVVDRGSEEGGTGTAAFAPDDSDFADSEIED